jgi:hypothetical protein
VEPDPGDESVRTESLVSSLYVGNKLDEWEIVFLQKPNKWVKHSLHHEIFMLFRWEIILSRKHVEKEMYVSITCENLVVNYSDFLFSKTFAVAGFCCV